MAPLSRSVGLAGVLFAAVALQTAAQHRGSSHASARPVSPESFSPSSSTPSGRAVVSPAPPADPQRLLPPRVHRFPLCPASCSSQRGGCPVFLLSAPWLWPGLWWVDDSLSSDADKEPAAGKPGEAGAGVEDGLTLLVLKNGSVFLAREYWLEGDRIFYLAREGGESSFAVAELDLEMSVKLNGQRGVEFILRSERASQRRNPAPGARHLYVPVTVSPK